jgi:hypothetical protein
VRELQRRLGVEEEQETDHIVGHRTVIVGESVDEPVSWRTSVGVSTNLDGLNLYRSDSGGNGKIYSALDDTLKNPTKRPTEVSHVEDNVSGVESIRVTPTIIQCLPNALIIFGVTRIDSISLGRGSSREYGINS